MTMRRILCLPEPARLRDDEEQLRWHTPRGSEDPHLALVLRWPHLHQSRRATQTWCWGLESYTSTAAQEAQ